MKKILVICFSILGIVTSIDVILFEFFDIGTSQFQNYILLYLVIYLFEIELYDSPSLIFSNPALASPIAPVT